jgi:hypothetical protein
MLLILCAVLLAGSILTGPVWAANDEARALYAKGAFLEASQLAANAGTAEGFALAARALSQHSGRQSATQQEQLQAQCESYARKAIALDAKYANGHFELAAAIGELGRLRGTGWAFLNGVANVVKDNLEKAISLDRPCRPGPLACRNHLQGRGIALRWRGHTSLQAIRGSHQARAQKHHGAPQLCSSLDHPGQTKIRHPSPRTTRDRTQTRTGRFFGHARTRVGQTRFKCIEIETDGP